MRLLILVVFALGPGIAQSETDPVRLVVHSVTEAPCGTHGALRQRVAGLLERDPFVPTASSLIQVRFGAFDGGLDAQISFTEDAEKPAAHRTLRTHGPDCQALLGAVALSVVLAVDPVRGLALAAEVPLPERSAEPPPESSVVVPDQKRPTDETGLGSVRATPGGRTVPRSTAADLAAAPPPMIPVPAPPEAPSETKAPEMEAPASPPSLEGTAEQTTGTAAGAQGATYDGITIGGGLFGGLGSGLGADLALHVDWTVEIDSWGYGTYFRWAPNFEFAHQGGTVEADLTSFGVHVCRLWGRVSACGLAAGGLQYAQGTDGVFDTAKRIDAPYLALGARGGVRLVSIGHWDLSSYAEVFTPLSRLRILAQGHEVWRTPPASVHLGLVLGFVLPE